MEMTDEQIAKLMADPRVKKAILEAVTAGNGDVKDASVADNRLNVHVKHEVVHPEEGFWDYAADVGRTCLKVAVVGGVAYATVWGIAKLLGPAIDTSDTETIDV